jgi:hypothetical protein
MLYNARPDSQTIFFKSSFYVLLVFLLSFIFTGFQTKLCFLNNFGVALGILFNSVAEKSN